MISMLQPRRSLALTLIGALLLLSSVVLAEAAPLQVVTSLTRHTATQLLDGRVLVAGGDGANTRFYRPSVLAGAVMSLQGSTSRWGTVVATSDRLQREVARCHDGGDASRWIHPT